MRKATAVIVTIVVFVLFGVRLVWVKASTLKDPHLMPSQELFETHPGHPLGLEKPDTDVTPPYHKPANLPGDWWLRHHAIAQNRGDFNTAECQTCHDVERYCNRCHGYVGVPSVEPEEVAAGSTTEGEPATQAAD